MLLLQALKFRGGVPERRGRKPTRAEKGSYIDNADLEQEVHRHHVLLVALVIDCNQKLGACHPIGTCHDSPVSPLAGDAGDAIASQFIAAVADCRLDCWLLTTVAAALQLADIATKVPDDISLYDLRTAAPGLYLPRSDALEEMLKYGKEHMDELLADVSEQLYFPAWVLFSCSSRHTACKS